MIKRIFPPVLIFFLLANVSAALTQIQAQEWRKQIKETLFIPTPLPQLDAKVHDTFDPEKSIRIEKVTYNTQFNMKVPAILYMPKSRRGKIPGLIIVNGHGGDKYSWYAFYSGIMYARAGAAVLTFDPVGEGERNIDRKSGTRAHDTLVEPREMAQRMRGQLICDIMQAVSYLYSREEVDKDRIAIMGYSLGSFISSIAGAIDPRIHACVLAGGGDLDEYNGYWDNTKPMCQGIPYKSLSFLGDRGAAIYAMHALRGPTFVINGLNDTVVAIPTHNIDFFADLKTRTAKLLGTSDGLFETEFVPEASHRPYFVTRPVVLWLEDKLDFPVWNKQDILSMPETHISEWAKENGVDMDPRYATEEREGGVMALGTGVPALTRDMLSVFEEPEWEKIKNDFIYENWVSNAKKLIEHK